MDFSKSYVKADPTLAKDGVEVELEDGGVIIVRPIRNADFRKYLDQLRKPFERKIQQKRFSQDQEDKLTRKAIAKHVLIGWKGIQIDGKDVKYSPAKAEELMIEYDEFQDDVLAAATARETFASEVVEENEKNS